MSANINRWREMIMTIAGGHVYLFKKEPEVVLKKLSYDSIYLEILSTVYGYLLHDEVCEPLENIDREMKKKLEQHAHEIYPTATDAHFKKICKSIWALNHLI